MRPTGSPADPTTPQASGLAGDLGVAFRGVLMGAADVVPGVSGGTIALIVGIYTRLVTALAHFDGTLLALFRKRQFVAAARHIDLRFLLALGTGILTGILSLARLMTWLLIHHHASTFAAFFGLILASGVLVAKRVDRWTLGRVLLLLLATAAAFWFTGAFTPAHGGANAEIGLGYLFLCGVIGICAMILPGISGSFVLLILGAYGTVIGMVSSLSHGDLGRETLLGLAVFAIGCGVGLLSFSKILRWLLAHYQAATLAVLCGIMLGAVRGVWPFREVSVNDRGHPEFGPNLWPTWSEALLPALIALAAAGFVIGIDWLAGRWVKQRQATAAAK